MDSLGSILAYGFPINSEKSTIVSIPRVKHVSSEKNFAEGKLTGFCQETCANGINYEEHGLCVIEHL